MEATALSVGKSVLNGALGYAKSAFAEEVALQLGIQQDHAFVADELEMMQSFMMEAHEKRDDSKVSQTWVKQVRDTAYDVEDSLQDFAVHLKRPSWWRFRRTLLERRRVAKQMKELRAKVEDVSQRNARYRLTQGSGSSAPAAKQSSFIAASIFSVDDARRAAKKENQRMDLIQLINKEGEDLKVIAVWGTSGDLGMTSIIRKAYENPDVQTKFPGRAWVRVMHPFCPKAFVQSLVNQLHAAEGVEGLLETENSEKDLSHKFNGYINEKRCLIVFNDLSTIEEWDQIRKCFQNNKKGSRIIVSTEQVEVASLCAGHESQALELKQVSADQTLYAFYEKALRNGMDSTKPESSLDVATRSINDHAAVPREITDDQYKDAGKKKMDVKSFTTCAGVLEATVKSTDVAATSSKKHMLAPAEIIEEQSKDADEKKVATKSLGSNEMSVGALKESQLIGREKDISKIIELISKKDSQQGQVISVWGMGGLGKTTLVNSVSQMLKLTSDKFDKCVFATVMRPFVLENLLRSLVEKLHAEPSKEELLSLNKKGQEIIRGVKNKAEAMSGDHSQTQELERLLKMTSCLIVLDDLSSTMEWDQIRTNIPFMEKESQIIVTTREQNIAKHCSGKHGHVHDLKVLEPSDALDLFSTKVFEKATDLVEKYPELVEEAQQILKKCEGLPLAIVAIGGFLAKQPKTLSEWRKLNENISAELELNPELGMIKTVLEKSYDGLPYDLKSCFLYLSIFPKDYKISRRRLVRRWMAEGYSNERRGRSANEMADRYFTDLQSRSMILPSQQSVHSIKSIDSCKVHDLIREIAISKSAEENLVFRLEEGCNLNTHCAIRHLSIQSNWKRDQSELESIVDLSRIRSLTVFGQMEEFFISDKMRFLRVLDLEDTEGLVNHHLDHIGKLLHLKYLSLRGCDYVFKLPDSLGNLRQLQTLDIRDTSIMTLPKTIIKLRKLHYIHAGQKSEYVQEEGTSLMTRCQNLLKAVPYICAVTCSPSRMGTGFNRRDACTWACCVLPPAITMGLFEADDGVTVPRGIWKLKDMHTLRVVNVGVGNGAVLQDIGKLTGLRKLGVTGVNEKNSKPFCTAVSNLSRLESLSVRSAGKNGLCGYLRDISPPNKLQSLELYGNLETLPEWIKKLQHLVKLELGSTRLPEHAAAMEFLGKLPELKILGLSGPTLQVQEQLRFQSEQAGVAFGSLRVLKLEEISDTKSVKFEEGTMPKLKLLLVQGRINNEIVFSGLEFLPSINEVQLNVFFSSDEEMAFPEDGETWDNILEERVQEERRKKAQLKKEIQEQLARNTNQPRVTVN